MYRCDIETAWDTQLFSLQAGEGTRAVVVPAWGCTCTGFDVGGLPVLEALPLETIRKAPASHGIPIMFPYPNRIRDGRFRFRGREYGGDLPRHGLVRDKAWTLVDHGASEEAGAWVTARLDAAEFPEQILSRYPWPFRIQVTYRLRDRRLTMETRVENPGSEPMPCGFGIHPYFQRLERCAVSVPAAARWELVEYLPTGARHPVAGTPFDLRAVPELGDRPLDDLYTELAADPDGLTRCYLESRETGRRTVIEFDPRLFPHLIAYTAPAPRDAVCLEPQTCPTDAFNLEARGIPADVCVLSPGAAAEFRIAFYTEPGSVAT